MNFHYFRLLALFQRLMRRTTSRPVDLVSRSLSEGGSIAESKVQPKPHAPTAGKPCLQSSRLIPTSAANLGISAERLNKVELLLTELGVPKKLLPTRAVCDLYDEVYCQFTIKYLSSR